MAIALFITPNELKQSTIIDGSVDADIIVPNIQIGQEVWMQEILGTDLYTRLQNGIIADDLTVDEVTLWEEYIKLPLIFFTAADFLIFSSYQVKQAGVYKHNAENSINADKSEIDSISHKYTQLAEKYSDRLIKYLQANSGLYTEYSTNSFPNTSPSNGVRYGNVRFTKEENRNNYLPNNWNE